MDKEFEALEDWVEEKINEDEISISDLEYFKKIKSILLGLKSIKETKSSDVFEYVENIQGEIEWAFEFNNGKIEEYNPRIMNIIKQYILKAQEQEKVLKIIKEKNVDVRFLRTCNVLNDYNYCQYLSDELSQEEFDTLKHYFITFKIF